ncbi:MAG TPA: class I SAM-dependent methyltransferase [Acidimicrobiales bacterium]|nr:class I SAM-dependent methyltransferase [Acidimicrobiales bacterium]
MDEVNEAATVGFGAASDAYERGRPSYPPAVIGVLTGDLGVGPGRRVLDLAAGTGKLTRLLVPTGADVVAVEPVAAMREQMQSAVPGVEVLEGTAEAIPLPDGSVDAVTAAQAFHWFRPGQALAEIRRVLRPSGGLLLVWNERDVSVPWVAAVSEVIDWDGRRPYEKGTDWAEVVADAGGFTPLQQRRIRFEHEVDEETLVDRMLSTSYVAAGSDEERREVEAGVRAVVAGFPERFALPYVTDIFWCTRD